MNGNTQTIVDNGSGVNKVVWSNPGDPNDYVAFRSNSTGYLNFSGYQSGFSGYDFNVNGSTNIMRMVSGKVGVGSGVVFGLARYTVATLPACSSGTTRDTMAVVSDATAPTYNGALTGGGAVVVPVFCNGSAWVAH